MSKKKDKKLQMQKDKDIIVETTSEDIDYASQRLQIIDIIREELKGSKTSQAQLHLVGLEAAKYSAQSAKDKVDVRIDAQQEIDLTHKGVASDDKKIIKIANNQIKKIGEHTIKKRHKLARGAAKTDKRFRVKGFIEKQQVATENQFVVPAMSVAKFDKFGMLENHQEVIEQVRNSINELYEDHSY